MLITSIGMLSYDFVICYQIPCFFSLSSYLTENTVSKSVAAMVRGQPGNHGSSSVTQTRAIIIDRCYICTHRFVHFRRDSQNCEKRLLASSCLSVCLSAWNSLTCTERIFMRIDIWSFMGNVLRKYSFA